MPFELLRTGFIVTGPVLIEPARSISNKQSGDALGARIEALNFVAGLKRYKATLLPIMAHTRKRYKNEVRGTPRRGGSKGGRKGRANQLHLIVTLDQLGIKEETHVRASTEAAVLDCMDQAMVFLVVGYSEVMKCFLFKEVIGNDPRFCKLSRVLSVFDSFKKVEMCSVDGILARNNGFGL